MLVCLQRVYNRSSFVFDLRTTFKRLHLFSTTKPSNTNGHFAASKHAFSTSQIINGYTVCVEGNIGSGKTTFLNYFLNIPNTEVIQEPVNLWRNIRGTNALKYMYQDPRRWSMSLQTYIQLTMLDIHTQPQTAAVRLMERSIHSARYCFVEYQHQSGLLPDLEYAILDEWYQWINQTQDVHVDLYVYLSSSPENCFHRIKKRNRCEEISISMELLWNLHQFHEDWFIHDKIPSRAPVLVIDANCDLALMFKKYKEYEGHIMGKYAAAN